MVKIIFISIENLFSIRIKVILKILTPARPSLVHAKLVMPKMYHKVHDLDKMVIEITFEVAL